MFWFVSGCDRDNEHVYRPGADRQNHPSAGEDGSCFQQWQYMVKLGFQLLFFCKEMGGYNLEFTSSEWDFAYALQLRSCRFLLTAVIGDCIFKWGCFTLWCLQTYFNFCMHILFYFNMVQMGWSRCKRLCFGCEYEFL